MLTPPLTRFHVAERDRPRGEIRALLRAHIAAESSRRFRQGLINVLAALGCVMAIGMAFPRVVPVSLSAALLELWATCSVGVIAAAALEWHWRRREARLLEADAECAGDPPEAADVSNPGVVP